MQRNERRTSVAGTLAVFDDGSGPALIAGGEFTTAGGVAARRIARWDGASWSAFGPTMFGGGVEDLVVLDTGSGQTLFAGGRFTNAGGVTLNGVARWNGTGWSALGSGMTDDVATLATFDDGDGPALFAGGRFTTAGGVAASRIARWDGASWSALDAGLASGVWVLDLAVFEGRLCIGGDFLTSPGRDSYLAAWGCARKTASRSKP